MSKTCPFKNNKECNEDCQLFVKAGELNEFVESRLCSIGVVDRINGGCSLKILALSQARTIFESTNTRG